MSSYQAHNLFLFPTPAGVEVLYFLPFLCFHGPVSYVISVHQSKFPDVPLFIDVRYLSCTVRILTVLSRTKSNP
jgi:hypothetical protein